MLAAARSGFGRVLVAAADGADEVERSLAGTAAALVAPGIPELPPGRIVILSTRVLPQPGWFRSLLEMPVEPERLYIDPPSVALVETADPQVVLSALELGEPIADLFRRFQQRFQTVDRRLGGEGKIEIAQARDLPRAEKWLLKGLIKETEGFMSRHVERRISLALTRRLASTRITPNAMTAVSVAVGLAGAGFFLSARPAWQFTGALLFLLHSILDGCDGELARLKFQESRFGGVLDFWGDNVVHVAVFAAIAIGWSRSIGGAWPLLVGAAAIGGTILSAGFVYRHTIVEVREGPLFTSVSPFPQSRLSRMADALARRDFIYLVLILSAFGKAHWFLVLAAVGAPVFFFVLVSIGSAGRHLERKRS